MPRDFKKLEIWRRSYALALAVYTTTSKFPDSEKFGLTNQLRRASASISANIAEGCGRSTNLDFLRFLYNSFGSLNECQTFLMFSRDLGYIKKEEFDKLNEQNDILDKMLNKFINSIKYDIKMPTAKS